MIAYNIILWGFAFASRLKRLEYHNESDLFVFSILLTTDFQFCMVATSPFYQLNLVDLLLTAQCTAQHMHAQVAHVQCTYIDIEDDVSESTRLPIAMVYIGILSKLHT